MANGIKIKEENLIKKCTHCFNSHHIVFNFAYISYEDNFEDKEKIDFLNRLRKLSKSTYIAISNMDKKLGFENIRIDIKKEIPDKFENEIDKFDGKYTIFRLYPNNNPKKSRIIGKMINKVFYIFYIDIKGDLYKH